MPSENLTALLSRAADGDQDAEGMVWQRVYPDLKRLAHSELRRGRPGDTLQTTALVHEAYLQLVDQTEAKWNDRVHFYATAAKIIRRILINYARRRNRLKRGGGEPDLPLDDQEVPADERAENLLALDEALSRLSALNDRMVSVVECRFFGGMTVAETAHAIDVSESTIERDWRRARAWLSAELSDSPSSE